MRPATYLLREERDRAFAIRAVTVARLGLEVVIKVPKRSTQQNKRLWSMLQAIADSGKDGSNSGAVWAGRTWDTEDWKDILLHAFLTDKDPDKAGVMVPGMNGGVLVLGRVGSSDLDTIQFGEFMDSIIAFMDTHDPPIPWAETGPEPPPQAYENER